jgi:hypothetical protein
MARIKAVRAAGLANNSLAANFTLCNIGTSSFIQVKVILLSPVPYQTASYISQQKVSAKSLSKKSQQKVSAKSPPRGGYLGHPGQGQRSELNGPNNG